MLLLTQYASWALALARDNAGSSNAARIAMIAITTSSSINVKALVFFMNPTPTNGKRTIDGQKFKSYLVVP